MSDEEFERLCQEKETEAIAFIENNTNPLELHVFADTYNWDKDDGAMVRIAQHPYCEAGTALMIYWLIDPVYYLAKYASRKEAEEDPGYVSLEHYDLLHYIQNKYISGGYPKKFVSYDPVGNNDAAPPDKTRGEGKQEVPPIMYEPVTVDN